MAFSSPRCRSRLHTRHLAGLVVAAMFAVGAPASAPAAGTVPCWFPPVVGTVTDPFREPPCPWCAGNRGIDHRVRHDDRITVAASGRVEFVGTVVDVRYVVVRLTNGWRHTYGQLAATALDVGDAVLAGSTLGRSSDTFFFGLRIGEEYADPAPFIGLLRSRARLIPIDDTPRRPAPPARPLCPDTRTAR